MKEVIISPIEYQDILCMIDTLMEIDDSHGTAALFDTILHEAKYADNKFRFSLEQRDRFQLWTIMDLYLQFLVEKHPEDVVSHRQLMAAL